MLLGQHIHNIDSKDRIVIPSKFRDLLGLEVVITKGIDSCLLVYKKESFEKVIETLDTIPFTNNDLRIFKRLFLSSATICLFDKQGRIPLNKNLINYASLNKECIIIGLGTHLEIWDKESFFKYYDENYDNISTIANELFK